jgi:guanylate cyclase soluble subunit beta
VFLCYCRVLELDIDTMLEKFGEYFIVFVREDGYEEMLRCLGDSLKEWISNINHLHVHLEHTLSVNQSTHKFNAPLFW